MFLEAIQILATINQQEKLNLCPESKASLCFMLEFDGKGLRANLAYITCYSIHSSFLVQGLKLPHKVVRE